MAEIEHAAVGHGAPGGAGDNPEVHHEGSDVNVRTILAFGAGLIVAAVLIHLLVWLLFLFFAGQEEASRGTPEYPLAAVTWMFYAALLVLRQAYGWRGRRAARLTLAGFGVAVLVLVIYLVRRMAG